MAGPLQGFRIIELAGLGPGPFGAMMLADHGAEVIRVERPGAIPAPGDPTSRSRKVVALDLKAPDGVQALRALARSAHALIDVYRPGAMERLGLGPEILLGDNPALIYARMTGWGQTGPYAPVAGHDINYIALGGAGHSIGPAELPMPPLGMVGDFGGGGMLLAFSIVSALLEAQRTGEGQIIDCAMVEGAGLLMALTYGMHATGQWEDRREANLLDGGAHFYANYRTLDGRFVAIGAIEPQFYRRLMDALGLADDPDFKAQMDRARWPILRRRLADIFAARTRDEWCALLEHEDVCFAPVLSLAEAPHHPHAAARSSFVTHDGILQPAPVPRYSRTMLDPPRATVATDAASLLDGRPGG